MSEDASPSGQQELDPIVRALLANFADKPPVPSPAPRAPVPVELPPLELEFAEPLTDGELWEEAESAVAALLRRIRENPERFRALARNRARLPAFVDQRSLSKLNVAREGWELAREIELGKSLPPRETALSEAAVEDVALLLNQARDIHRLWREVNPDRVPPGAEDIQKFLARLPKEDQTTAEHWEQWEATIGRIAADEMDTPHGRLARVGQKCDKRLSYGPEGTEEKLSLLGLPPRLNNTKASLSAWEAMVWKISKAQARRRLARRSKLRPAAKETKSARAKRERSYCFATRNALRWFANKGFSADA